MQSDRNILVCFAVREEAGAFRKCMAGHDRVRILVHGMGQANARREVLPAMEQHSPSLVLTCGFAGGLDPQFANGTVVHEAADDFLALAALERSGSRRTTFHCADRVASTAVEKQRLRQQTNCGAVEMESGVIRQLCRDRGIPAATVRVISDAADEDLPLDFNRLMTPDYRMDFVKLAGAIVCAPGKIGGLMRFQKQLKAGATSLAEVLAAVIAAA